MKKLLIAVVAIAATMVPSAAYGAEIDPVSGEESSDFADYPDNILVESSDDEGVFETRSIACFLFKVC